MDSNKLLLFILCLISLCSCNESKKNQSEKLFYQNEDFQYLKDKEVVKRIELIKNFEIEEKIEIQFKRISKIAVDKYDRLYLENNKGVHVYQKDGRYLKTIGQNGRGPGEFQTIHNLKIRNDSIYVYDASLGRISVFDIKTHDLINEISIPSTNGLIGLGDFGILEDGKIVIGLRGTKKNKNSVVTENFVEYFFLTRTGILVKPSFHTSNLVSDFIIVNNKGTSYPPIPFDRTTFFTISDKNEIYFAWTGEIAFKKYNSEGEFIKGFHYSFNNLKVSNDDDFPEFHKNLGFVSDTKRILGNKLPKTFPAIAHFFTDDEDRLWLATIVPDEKNYEWWILGNDGDQIAKFLLSKNSVIRTVKNNKAYVVATSLDTRVPTIISYELKWIQN
ncbi:6-bladed beta-propeller [bacterium]|nr:6-bladed beta-propeller [bacterium]